MSAAAGPLPASRPGLSAGRVTSVVADAAAAGVTRVWLHRGMGPGSVSEEAIAVAREHGLRVIPGGCPNMFGACSDAGHRGMRRMLTMTGKLPRTVDDPPLPVPATVA